MNKQYISSVHHIVAFAFLGIFGNLVPYIIPVLVGGVIDQMGLTTGQGGYVATADMLGLGLGAYIWSRFVLDVNWRNFTRIAILTAAAGNFTSAFISDFDMLLAARVVAGIGGGALLALGNSGLAMTRNPDRTLAFIAMISMLVAASMVHIFSSIRESYQMQGVFMLMGVIMLLLLVATFFMPERSLYASSADNKSDIPKLGIIEIAKNPVFAVTILATFIFFMGAINFWVYIERAGVEAGFSNATITKALSISQFAGAAGALTTAILATRLSSRLVPTFCMISLAAISSVIIASGAGITTYTLAMFGLGFAWTGYYPILMGTLISLDNTGQLLAHGVAAQTFGKVIGPMLIATFLMGESLAPVYWVSFIMFATSLLLFLPGLLKLRAAPGQPEPAG